MSRGQKPELSSSQIFVMQSKIRSLGHILGVVVSNSDKMSQKLIDLKSNTNMARETKNRIHQLSSQVNYNLYSVESFLRTAAGSNIYQVTDALLSLREAMKNFDWIYPNVAKLYDQLIHHKEVYSYTKQINGIIYDNKSFFAHDAETILDTLTEYQHALAGMPN